MSEPSRSTITAAALVALLMETADVPELARLHDPEVFWRMYEGSLMAAFYSVNDGPQILAATQQYFGGEIKPGTSHGIHTVQKVLHTVWHGVPFEIGVPVPKVDEVAELRNQIAELQAAAAAGARVTA